MKLTMPELALVALVGPSGSGKSTFARKHFLPTQTISSDFCRGLVSDDENDQAATKDAFEILHFIAGKRLTSGKLTVIDATNVQPEGRKPLVRLAKEHDCLAVAIVFNLPEKLCHERNRERADRAFGQHVVHRQLDQLRRSLRHLQKEGFRYVYVLESPEDVEAAEIDLQPLWVDRRADTGPFDIVGDVHGCYEELTALIERLGYQLDGSEGERSISHADGRRLIFLGDLGDRGPDTPAVLRLVMKAVADGSALCIPGNHDQKLLRALGGRQVHVSHGLQDSLDQLEAQPPEFRKTASEFIDGLVSHYVLDGGQLVVAHAGMKEEYQGRASRRVREFALFGETTGETDEFGLPVRVNWAQDYRGRASVVYGHTPVPEARWVNNTINIDTGCVFGGALTALRYPEKELVSVPAARVYYEPAKPFLVGDASPVGREAEDILDIRDVTGKRIVETSLAGNVTIPEDRAAAALEVMSRFAVDHHWLIYLPPTMSPTEVSTLPGLLEHPDQAFAYYRKHGVGQVVCEEKHMGSRAIVVICRDEEAATRRFGVAGDAGVCYTRTGRRFLRDDVEREFLDGVRAAATSAGLWEEFQTDWLCLDCELMPWSAKAEALLRNQYAAVGSAATTGLSASVAALEQAAARLDVGDLLDKTRARQEMVTGYVAAYRKYCWEVKSVSDLKLAPFHLLATEGAVHTDKTHAWHLEVLGRLAAASSGSIVKTPARTVDLADEGSAGSAVAWWEDLTGSGGEGMVVKPSDFITRARGGVLQPGIKCRGREYLRIIYGPEYTTEANLERLRNRFLGLKRSLAKREFALGVEALDRFVRKEPLYRVHECVFGVLAMESEPVDPAL